MFDSSTTSLPDGLTVVKGAYGEQGSNFSWTGVTSLGQSGAAKVFKYAASSDASSANLLGIANANTVILLQFM